MIVGDDHILVRIEASDKEKEIVEGELNVKNPYGNR